MTNNQNVRIGIAVVVGIIIALAGIWLWNNRTLSAPSASTTDTTGTIVDNNTAASSTITEEGNAGIVGNGPGIKIDDQNPGRLVTVAQVSLMTPGWVLIRDNNNGTPGNILGARLFDKGKNSGIVELLRPLIIGKSYFAAISNDDGNIHIFDPKKDLPIKDANGKDIMIKFSVTKATDQQP
jgi:hypothetical protein